MSKDVRKKKDNPVKELFIQIIVETCRLFELIRRIDEKTLKRVRQDFAERRIGSYASSTAFFFFISIIPMFTLISALIPHMGMSQEAVIEGMMAVTPKAVDEVVVLIIKDAFKNSTGILSLSFVALIWSSSKGTYSLIMGLNAVTCRKESSKTRGFVERNVMSVIYTVFLLVIIILMLVIMVFGGTIINFFTLYFPDVNLPMDMDPRLRFFFLILIATLFFMLVYNYMPDEDSHFMTHFPGALFSTLGWALFSGFFSLFIGKGSVYNTYYGSLATVVIFQIWLYGCFYIMLIGAYINVWLSGGFSDRNDVQIKKTPAAKAGTAYRQEEGQRTDRIRQKGKSEQGLRENRGYAESLPERKGGYERARSAREKRRSINKAGRLRTAGAGSYRRKTRIRRG